MPIYEYRCNSCGHEFEFIVLGSKEPNECQICGKNEVVKLISACSFFSDHSNSGRSYSGGKATGSSSSCSSCSASSCGGCK